MISVMQHTMNNSSSSSSTAAPNNVLFAKQTDSPEDTLSNVFKASDTPAAVNNNPFFWSQIQQAPHTENHSERESDTGSSPLVPLLPTSTTMTMPPTAGMYGFGTGRIPTASDFNMMVNPTMTNVYSDFYQNSLAASTWGYPYAQPYQFTTNYSVSSLDGNLSDATIPTTTAASSSASTPSASMTLPWAVSSHEGKKKRQPYKKDQISRLEYEYSVNSYLTNKRRAELSTQLMLDEKQVKVWFQNRRMKDKKLRQRISGPFPHGAPVTPCLERLIN